MATESKIALLNVAPIAQRTHASQSPSTVKHFVDFP
jgi:hypothetical protein